MAVFRAFCRNLRRILFMSVLCVVLGSSSSFGVTVTFVCPTNNTSWTVSPDSNGYYTMEPASLCSSSSGQEFFAWNCMGANNVSMGQYQYYFLSPGTMMQFNWDTTCTAVMRNHCPNISGRYPENVLVQQVDVNEVSSYAYQNNNSTYANSYTYGTSVIEGICSARGGSVGEFAHDLSSATGSHCWCRMSSFSTPAGVNQTTTYFNNALNWVLYGDMGSGNCSPVACAQECSDFLADSSAINSNVFRRSLYEACLYYVEYSCGSVGGAPSFPVAISNGAINGDTISWGPGVTGCNTNATLVGWYCHGDNAGNVFPVTSTNNGYSFVLQDEDTSCHAIWDTDPRYHVSYACGNNTTGNPPPQTPDNLIAGSYSVLPSTPGTCANNDAYAFYSWECYGDSTGNMHQQNANNAVLMSPGENVTCTARWTNKESEYRLVYECGAGSGTAPAVQVVPSAQNVTLQQNTCTAPSGFDFNGWLCYESSVGLFGNNAQTFQDENDTYYLDRNVTCVARWEEKSPCEPGNAVSGKEEILGMQVGLPMDSGLAWHDTGITLGDLFDSNTVPSIWWPNNPNGPYGLGFNNGNSQWMVEIAGMCSSNQGTPGEPGYPTPDVNGQYCWCSVDGYSPYDENPAIGDLKQLVGYPWVYLEPYGGICSDDACALTCVDVIDGEWTWLKWQQLQTDFWSHFIYSMYTKDICEYDINYYCNPINYPNTINHTGSAAGGQTNVNLWTGCSVPSGQQFAGWDCEQYTAPNSPVGVNNNRITMMPYDNVNCYAQWTAATYSLTYNCGTGTGTSWSGGNNFSMNAQTNTATVATATSHCTAPTGYSSAMFYWNCGGQNTQVTPGNSITITGNTTCTAEWSPIKYNITYVLGDNGVYGTDHPATAFYDTVFHVSNPTRSGYTFNGWNITGMNSGVNHYYGATNPPNSYVATTSQNFEGLNYFVEYFKNLSSIENATVTFTATWTPDATYNVSYTCGSIGGTTLSGQISPSTNNDSYVAGFSNVPLTSANNVNTSGCSGTGGYAFNGWKCHASGNNTTINNGYVISTMPAYNVICDALWAQTHTLVYDCSGCNTSNPASVQISPNTSVTLPNSCFSGAHSADYDFVAWNCFPSLARDEAGLFLGGDTYTVNDSNNVDTTCYGLCVNNAPCGISGRETYEVLGERVAGLSGVYWHDTATVDSLWATPADSDDGNNQVEFNTFPYGPYYIDLDSVCTANPGVPAVVDDPGTSNGNSTDKYCWCHVDNVYYHTDNSTPVQLDNYPWVFALGFNNYADCQSDCLMRCRNWLQTNQNIAGSTSLEEWFLHSLYTKAICEVNLSWVLNGGTFPQSQANPSFCEWGAGAISPLRVPSRTGYTFNGWKVTNWTQQ